jgi:hypothetical protein
MCRTGATLRVAFALLALTTGNVLSRAFGGSDGAVRRPGITFTNTDPEFTLTLPDRYLSIKSTGDALCTFGTADQSAGALVAIYRLGRTIEPGSTDISQFKMQDARRIDATWKALPLDVIAWHTMSDKGAKSAARWVQIPLQHQAISILVFVPLEKEAFADGLMRDFLIGLDGPTNWTVAPVLTSTERATRIALGLAWLVVLHAGLILGVRAWRRHVLRRKANPAASAPFQALNTALATPAPRKPGYWIRVFAVVFGLIGVALGYMALVAAGVALIFNVTWGDSFRDVLLVFESMCLLPLLVVSGVLAYGRRGRGRVLLDFGPDRLRNLFLSVSLLCLIAGAMSGAEAAMNLSSHNLQGLFTAVMQIALAIMFLIRGIGRVQITEKGIWQNSSLHRWDQIGSYRWENESTLLTVKGQGLASFTLPVPSERKQAVQDLLTEHGLVHLAT